MTRPNPISGFPEWLPAQRMVEQRFVDRIREVYELYGFAPIETRAVEPLDQLLRKGGDTDKEIYVLRRLQADADDGTDSGLGLHFDLTVPFARYVLENAGKLRFPFRRYQIQKAWRGERPQEGRYREFLQADADVVDVDALPFHYDVELALVFAEALGALPIPPFEIRTNSRKVCEGFYRGLGLSDPIAAMRAIDKLLKIGPEKVAGMLVETAGASDAQAKACLALAEISATDGSFVDRVRALGVSDPLLDEGLEELTRVVEAAAAHVPGVVIADLKIARGLDYYTGTVYEAFLRGRQNITIASGGRYDNLATAGETRYPGVGISIGITRLLGLLGEQSFTVSRSVPTAVLVALPDEQARAGCDRIATALRRRGIATEVAPEPAKYGKQIKFADRRGVPFVWFPGAEGEPDTVKDIRSGEQVEADATTWQPPARDLRPQITATSAQKEN
ncbi:MAG: histidine--tRNA ligase [Micromonosporaceae bacterium]